MSHHQPTLQQQYDALLEEKRSLELEQENYASAIPTSEAAKACIQFIVLQKEPLLAPDDNIWTKGDQDEGSGCCW